MRVTSSQLLTRVLVLRRALLREAIDEQDQFVGLLLPPSVAGCIANAAVSLANRVSVNLNYTLPGDALHACLAKCGIRKILTSRRVMERLDFEIDSELVFLEDLLPTISFSDKLLGLAQAKLLPIGALERSLGLSGTNGGDLFTIIFTSGSTGDPKGVMLTHNNVSSNIAAMSALANLRSNDCFLGILPFFHSFGFTCTLWGVLSLNVKGAYHFNPLEAETVAKLCREQSVTFMIGTPTLLRQYLRRCSADDLASLDVVIAGAEALPSSLADAFERKFGVRPVEGYGATECSPLISVNVPKNRASPRFPNRLKEGTVGRPIPEVETRIVDVETGAILGSGKRGMLMVRGPNVMPGYYQDPQRTEEVLVDNWYETGDFACLDDEGFISIAGRLSRFSKIGGEMVPHGAVEDALRRAAQVAEDELVFGVTSLLDPKKGEKLVVLHKPLSLTPDELRRRLRQAGLPPLWIPAGDSFCEVSELPVLGTGKLDLQSLKQLAQRRLAVST